MTSIKKKKTNRKMSVNRHSAHKIIAKYLRNYGTHDTKQTDRTLNSHYFFLYQSENISTNFISFYFESIILRINYVCNDFFNFIQQTVA